MKRTLFACLILALAPQFIFAGEGVVRDDKKAVVSTTPMEPCNWTGFYLGGNVGGAFAANADVKLDLGGDWNLFASPSDKDFITPLGSRDLDAAALVAGGFVGYNHQWNNWVFGLEAGIDYIGLRDSFNSGLLAVNPGSGDIVNVRQSFKTHYLATLGPRLGYSWNKFLWYVTGGLAIGDVDFKQSIKEPQFGFREAGSSDEAQIGWMIGAGTEYCLTPHWSARLEYRYTDLECADFSSRGNNGFAGFTGNHEACLTSHSLTAGFAYKF